MKKSPPKSSIIFQPSGVRGETHEGESILDAARRLDAGIESSCGGQMVCGRCRVKVDGPVTPPVREEAEMLTPSELAEGLRLACAAYPAGGLTVYVPEGSRPVKQIVLGEGAARTFRIDPAVRKCYVELKEPTPEDPTADAERLEAALARVYGLNGTNFTARALRRLPWALREGGYKITATVRRGVLVSDVEPGYRPRTLGSAFDVGTTTVAGYLLDLETGALLASSAMTNPQVAFGEDVMSRITYAGTKEEGSAEMQTRLVEALNGMLNDMVSEAGKGVRTEDVLEAVMVGNTAMNHILLGLPVGALGVYPFTPAVSDGMEFEASEIGLKINPAGYVVTLPVVGGFVGSDMAAALIVEEPWTRQDVTLIIDIGTNGELALAGFGKLILASCATGPAFEGAEVRFGMRASSGAIERVVIDPDTLESSYTVIGRPGWWSGAKNSGARGICGSGVVDAVAGMLRAGVLNSDGSFRKDLPHARVRPCAGGGMEYVIAWGAETEAGTDITVSSSDVRAVQLAKAAIRAGAEVLMSELGVSRPDRLVLAGAFGSYIDKANALAIGMLPDVDLERISHVGNAAGDGARAALLSLSKRREAEDTAASARHVELSMHPKFQEEFLKAMALPG